MLIGEIVADASFYICFLDCVGKKDYLVKILDKFKTHIPPKVEEEVKKSKNWKDISKHKNLNYFFKPCFDVGKVIQPLLSKEEIKKGEYDIIITAYFLYNLSNEKNFFIIIDDSKPRKFIERNVKELQPHLFGTVNFIKICCLDYKIFNNKETLDLYDDIEKSNFRIKKEILDFLRSEICPKL